MNDDLENDIYNVLDNLNFDYKNINDINIDNIIESIYDTLLNFHDDLIYDNIYDIVIKYINKCYFYSGHLTPIP